MQPSGCRRQFTDLLGDRDFEQLPFDDSARASAHRAASQAHVAGGNQFGDRRSRQTREGRHGAGSRFHPAHVHGAEGAVDREQQERAGQAGP